MLNDYTFNQALVNDTEYAVAFTSPPALTFRDATTPATLLSSISFYQTAPDGTQLPVLAGEVSDRVRFRIYNNYDLYTGISTAFNIQLAPIDGGGLVTQTKPVTTESWLMMRQTAFGESATATEYQYQIDGEISGVGTFIPERASDGLVRNNIRAGTDGAGMGFMEFEAWLEPPAGSTPGELTFGLLLLYEWIN